MMQRLPRTENSGARIGRGSRIIRTTPITKTMATDRTKVRIRPTTTGGSNKGDSRRISVARASNVLRRASGQRNSLPRRTRRAASPERTDSERQRMEQGEGGPAMSLRNSTILRNTRYEATSRLRAKRKAASRN